MTTLVGAGAGAPQRNESARRIARSPSLGLAMTNERVNELLRRWLQKGAQLLG